MRYLWEFLAAVLVGIAAVLVRRWADPFSDLPVFSGEVRQSDRYTFIINAAGLLAARWVWRLLPVRG
jgi:hypothetical protein